MNRIKEIREARGLSVAQLAARMGTTPQTVWRLQKEPDLEDIRLHWIAKLTGALGCTAADLIIQGLPRTSDVEPTTGTVPGHAGLKKRGVVFYRVVSDVLNEAGIAKGATIAVDRTTTSISEKKPGDAVVTRVANSGILLLRQFIPPALLTTNQVGPYAVTLKLTDPSVTLEIVGVVLQNGDVAR